MLVQKEKDNYNAYKDTEIKTADQKKLILMLYDGAIRVLRIAESNMTLDKYDVVNNNIIKAQDIITELMLALNMKQGGEIAVNLFNIYAFAKKRLLEANIAKEAKIIKEVINILKNLRAAWEEAAEIKDLKPQKALADEASLSIQV